RTPTGPRSWCVPRPTARRSCCATVTRSGCAWTTGGRSPSPRTCRSRPSCPRPCTSGCCAGGDRGPAPGGAGRGRRRPGRGRGDRGGGGRVGGGGPVGRGAGGGGVGRGGGGGDPPAGRRPVRVRPSHVRAGPAHLRRDDAADPGQRGREDLRGGRPATGRGRRA